MKQLVFVLLLWISADCVVVKAQPNFAAAISRHGVTAMPDMNQRNLFYYLPGDLEIGLRADGKPDFSFVMMRYTTSAVYGEQEGMRYRNLLNMRVVMRNLAEDSLRKFRQTLPASSRLVPIPITRIQAFLVFIPVGSNDSTAVIRQGNLTADGDNGYSTTSSYWQERYFTIHLDNHSANLLLEAFRKDYTAISFMYAFMANGKHSVQHTDFNGQGRLASALRRQLREITSDTTSSHESVVKSDAFPITVDESIFPDVIRQIDINNGVPPGYAILNVRNYDFANNLRTDLYEKTIELEASAAGRGKVKASVTFRKNAPDITSINFKFKYAVSLDQPYRYRVKELFLDGREVISDWQDVPVWSAMLDVTTRKTN
jgi:hypothetical protein